MRDREMPKVTKCVGVNSFVGALINMVFEPKITSGFKKIHGDPTLRLKVISEKQCYASMKHIVELFQLQYISAKACKSHFFWSYNAIVFSQCAIPIKL